VDPELRARLEETHRRLTALHEQMQETKRAIQEASDKAAILQELIQERQTKFQRDKRSPGRE
jgi:peptidoglycan hydrolase CwlO-like protein